MKAIVMDHKNISVSHSSVVYQLLKDGGFLVGEPMKGAIVAPEVFANLSGYDLIYYIGHGGIDNYNGGIVLISTGVLYSQLKTYKARYNETPLTI